MNQLDDYKVFVTIVDAGSLTAAASMLMPMSRGGTRSVAVRNDDASMQETVASAGP